MAVKDKFVGGFAQPRPAPTPKPAATPDDYAELVDRYVAETGRLKRWIDAMGIVAVSLGIAGFAFGVSKSDTKGED